MLKIRLKSKAEKPFIFSKKAWGQQGHTSLLTLPTLKLREFFQGCWGGGGRGTWCKVEGGSCDRGNYCDGQITSQSLFNKFVRAEQYKLHKGWITTDYSGVLTDIKVNSWWLVSKLLITQNARINIESYNMNMWGKES